MTEFFRANLADIKNDLQLDLNYADKFAQVMLALTPTGAAELSREIFQVIEQSSSEDKFNPMEYCIDSWFRTLVVLTRDRVGITEALANSEKNGPPTSGYSPEEIQRIFSQE